jgi:hypothetical protein
MVSAYVPTAGEFVIPSEAGNVTWTQPPTATVMPYGIEMVTVYPDLLTYGLIPLLTCTTPVFRFEGKVVPEGNWIDIVSLPLRAPLALV